VAVEEDITESDAKTTILTLEENRVGKMVIAEKDKLEPFKDWHFLKPGPRVCPDCHNGFIISTKRFGENVFSDKCSTCGKVFTEYKVVPR